MITQSEIEELKNVYTEDYIGLLYPDNPNFTQEQKINREYLIEGAKNMRDRIIKYLQQDL